MNYNAERNLKSFKTKIKLNNEFKEALHTLELNGVVAVLVNGDNVVVDHYVIQIPNYIDAIEKENELLECKIDKFKG